MAQRTFKPDVEKIEKLRVQKGWALPDLAVKACVSNRTIDSIMLGREVVISTMSRVAKALGVSPDSLIMGFHQQPSAQPKGKRFEVCFRIDFRVVDGVAKNLDFEDFDESSDLLTFLDKLKNLIEPLADDIEVTGVDKSSVVVRVKMSQHDILSVLRLYAQRDPHLFELFESMTINATREEFFEGLADKLRELPRSLFIDVQAK